MWFQDDTKKFDTKFTEMFDKGFLWFSFTKLALSLLLDNLYVEELLHSFL